MQEATRGPWPARLFGLCSFLGAFLIFQIQPLMSAWILPWFGGGAAVWTACLLFFQAALFAGYAYAHVSDRYLPPWPRLLVHLGLMIAALALLPIIPREHWKPSDPGVPLGRILLLLGASIGAPYLLLSSTAPLVQSWYGRLYPDRSPYRLYALSNAGSLLALLSYPFLFEPFFGRRALSVLWMSAFAVFVALFAAGARMAFRVPPAAETTPTGGAPVPLGRRALWILLPAFASAMLLASTNQMCEDVIVMPFFWVMPLAVYLLSFILAFDRPGFYRPRLWSLSTAVLVFGAAVLHRAGTNDSIYSLLQVLSILAATFGLSMLCHGEVARLKPGTRHLTSYYLSLAAGGALGGVFVNLAAPRLFSSFLEWKLGIGIAYAIAWGLFAWHDRHGLRSQRILAAVLLAILVAGGWFIFTAFTGERRPLESSRSFYGVITVEESIWKRPDELVVSNEMYNGRILHGRQYLIPEKRRKPTTYYGETSGVGRCVGLFESRADLRIGVVGLGVGTMAAYGKTPSQTVRFYEINPEAERLARDRFWFLQESPSRVEVVLGDARLSLEREAPRGYHVLVLDAFSGVTIPSHLLTVEAMEIYLRHLDGDGVIAMHVSNPYLDLAPVVRGLGRRFGLKVSRLGWRPTEDTDVLESSTWYVLTASGRAHEDLQRFTEPETETRELLWTDDRHDLASLLKWD
ncbi:MAG TPA: fused MFS/spermidine synthase [Planctomycetota bacterium]|nr:fused MFS/spermidine synthase [Planctomycetota bacterium]